MYFKMYVINTNNYETSIVYNNYIIRYLEKHTNLSLVRKQSTEDSRFYDLIIGMNTKANYNFEKYGKLDQYL